MKRTLEQNNRIYQLFTDLGFGGKDHAEDRGYMVQFYTGYRTAHTSEMDSKEAANLITHLHKMLGTLIQRRDVPNVMRRKFLSMVHQLGWYEFIDTDDERLSEVVMRNGKPKLDWKRINEWCKKYGFKHKPFNDYTEEELPELLTQFEKVVNSELQKYKA